MELGKQVIWLHTYGNRYADVTAGRPPGQPTSYRPRVIGSVGPRFSDMPTALKYESGGISLGGARIEPVSEAAIAYEVSGMKVIKHWFDYRKQKPSGRVSSPLDEEIKPTQWSLDMTEELRNLVAVVEGCIRLEARQADLLGRIAGGRLISVAELEESGVLPPDAPSRRISVEDRRGTLF